MAEFELRTIPFDKITIKKRTREVMGDIEELTNSIREHGIIQPLAVDQELNLLAGFRRYTAVKQLGFDSVPVIVKTIEGETDALEIELFENIHRMDMTWQEECKLVKQIHELQCKKHGADWGQGKTAELLGRKSKGGINKKLQVADILEAAPELAILKTEDDVIKAVDKMERDFIVKELRKRHEAEQSVTGNAVRYAANHYQIKDAFEGMNALEDTVISLIEVDPPYGIELSDAKKRTTSTNSDLSDYSEVAREDYIAFLKKLSSETYRVAAEHCWMIFWFGPTWHCEVKRSLEGAGWSVDDIPGIWDKGHGQTQQPKIYLARAYEPFFICRKGNPALAKQGRSNVFTFAPVSPAKKYHPTQRPLELMQELLTIFANPGALCFVPFLGSGVTLRAAYKADMKGFGYDLDPKLKDSFLVHIAEDEAEDIKKEKE